VGHTYKNKYIAIRDVYKSIRKTFDKYFLFCKIRKRKVYKTVDYGIYYSIIRRFFEILIRDVVERNRQVYLPARMGHIYLDEKPHKRAFHIRVDNDATKEQGKTVFCKVPILDDYYKKLIWIRPPKYRNCKIMPLRYLKEIINKN